MFTVLCNQKAILDLLHKLTDDVFSVNYVFQVNEGSF